MERFAPTYIFFCVIHRFTEFFRHWYVRSFVLWMHSTLTFLENLDQTFALKITLRHFGEPLFQDRGIVGYILGFVFRSGRVVISVCLYGIVIFLAVVFYLAWCASLPFIIYKILI